MFPITSLLLGSSLIWSVTPHDFSQFSATITGRVHTEAPLLDRHLHSEAQLELFSALQRQRYDVLVSEYETAYRACCGLQSMLEDGDRRVMTAPELSGLAQLLPRCQKGEGADALSRVRHLWLAHADLESEALAAYEKLDKRTLEATLRCFLELHL